MQRDDESIERRTDLSSKVAVLEERSINNKENLAKFSQQFLLHSRAEEILLSEVEDSLQGVGRALDDKLINELRPVKGDVEDIKKEITRWKTIAYVLWSIAGGVIAIIVFFKEPIFRYLFKG